MKRYSYLFLAALALSSCQNDDNNTIYNDFGGMYKITSMQSENPLDLNNDGIQSFDLYEEIAAPVYSSKNTSDQSHSIISTNGQTMQKSDRHFMTKAIIRFFY